MQVQFEKIPPYLKANGQFFKHLKKHDKVTVYSSDNIPLNIYKEPYIGCDGSTVEFELDCVDLVDYCNMLGLHLNHNN